MVLEEVDVFGNLIDLPVYFLEFGLEALEIGLEVEHLLGALLLLALPAALALVEHSCLLILLSFGGV